MVCIRCGSRLHLGKKYCSYKCHNGTIIDRFNKFVVKKEGCWDWKGCKNYFGYGRISYNGKPKSAHRVSYILYVGEIPEDMHVLHKCNNPICTNPDHLYLGKDKENARDKVKDNRQVYGERCILTKFSKEKIAELRHKYPKGTKVNEKLAISENISRRHLKDIIEHKHRRIE